MLVRNLLKLFSWHSSTAKIIIVILFSDSKDAALYKFEGAYKYVYFSVADLPGLIENSHKNNGLGIQFLKHVERCTLLLYVIDVSLEEPWTYLSVLEEELLKFNPSLNNRPSMVVANKTDLLSDDSSIIGLSKHTNKCIIPVSAKKGTNLKDLLMKIREMYEQNKEYSD